MSHQHLSQDRIWPSVALLTLLFASPLQAQNNLDRLTDSLKQNVIAIKVIFTDDSEEKGFGFITGEQNGRLFLATAAHVVRGIDNDKTAKFIKARFYNDYRWFDAAFIRHWDQEDLALLEMAQPTFVRWRQECADLTPGTDSKVRFIGLNKNEPSWVDPGLDGKIFQQTEQKLSFAINTILPGTSGAPLITEKGIVGLIIKDEGTISEALKLTQIKVLFSGGGQYPYFALQPLGLIANSPGQTGRSAISPEINEDGLVLVKGGTFTMGCNTDQGNSCEKEETPMHWVTLSDFYMGKYEVTQAQWRSVMGSDPADLAFKGCDECPVQQVSWDDIQEFLNKLNAKTGKKYRLPTESEWEFAARGGIQKHDFKYPGSNNAEEVAWLYVPNGDNKTHPVGTKKANGLGLYDMGGNVTEWCQDWYGPYPNPVPRQTNPPGPASGTDRVYRGGSWIGDEVTCRVTGRSFSPANFRSAYLGFRLVLQL